MRAPRKGAGHAEEGRRPGGCPGGSPHEPREPCRTSPLRGDWEECASKMPLCQRGLTVGRSHQLHQQLPVQVWGPLCPAFVQPLGLALSPGGPVPPSLGRCALRWLLWDSVLGGLGRPEDGLSWRGLGSPLPQCGPADPPGGPRMSRGCAGGMSLRPLDLARRPGHLGTAPVWDLQGIWETGAAPRASRAWLAPCPLPTFT